MSGDMVIEAAWSSAPPPWARGVGNGAAVTAGAAATGAAVFNSSDQTLVFWRNDSALLDYGPIYNVITPSNATENKVTMNPWIYLSWTAVFSLMIFVAIGGNLIVMWIVVAHRRMRTVTNYFLVNLSSADLLMSTLNCIFNYIYMIHNHWPFGEWYCTVNNFMATVTVSASVYTLTAITCDRYMAIVRPLKPRMSKKIALVAITFVWIASIIIGIPCLLYSATHTYSVSGRARIVCILIWPDGMSFRSQMDFTYQVALMVLSYFVPIILMVCCYYGIGRVLWGSRSIGEMSQRQADSIRSKRKVVKMFIFVMVVFVVCWLPYHGYFVYTHFDDSILYTRWVQHLYLGFYWLAMSNAMVNPLIYYWMNARFRKYFRTAVCGWSHYLAKKSMRFQGGQGNETPVLGRHTHSFSRSGIVKRLQNKEWPDEMHSEPMHQLSRWFSRRSRHRQTSTSIVRDSSKYRASPLNGGAQHHQHQQLLQQQRGGGDAGAGGGGGGGSSCSNQALNAVNGHRQVACLKEPHLQSMRRKQCFTSSPDNNDYVETAQV